MKLQFSSDYRRLLTDIKERVRSAQYQALKAVNKVEGPDAHTILLRGRILDVQQALQEIV